MALDRWFPTRFADSSDRFVTQNGILLMGAAALVMLVITRGSVALLVVRYSIDVFITFTLSQLGMVVHWWRARRTEPSWRRKLAVNGFGLALTTFILISLTVVKFHEGGWATLLVTGVLVAAAFAIKRHYSTRLHAAPSPRRSDRQPRRLRPPPIAPRLWRRQTAPPFSSSTATTASVSTPSSTSPASLATRLKTSSSSRSARVDAGRFQGHRRTRRAPLPHRR